MLFDIFIQLSFSYFATVAFGLFINVPRKALNAAGISGAVGWMTYWFLVQAGINAIPANFMGGLGVGLIGLVMSQYKRIPSTIFNIPGLVPLVPGASAYQALILLLSGEMDAANEKIFSVIMIGGAIAMGYVVSQLVSEQYFRHRRNKVLAKNDEQNLDHDLNEKPH
ncbi:threonine/serine exporter [Weissella viridescens]|uniref:Threonine/serine exporter n=1 Tax=Weissella viridescens TaxID=1629 RepID=A0A3P2REJ7_WEIVI|nr:threonine/serine exporter family protein [Weissella viridescens]RRG18066.1 threonine/serine exporter [Weissella viridescens]